jgi:uncharacterized protein (UPF0371 family)
MYFGSILTSSLTRAKFRLSAEFQVFRLILLVTVEIVRSALLQQYESIAMARTFGNSQQRQTVASIPHMTFKDSESITATVSMNARLFP